MMNALPPMDLTALGDRLPRRHRPKTAYLARLALQALGWKITGSLPNIPQAVIIGVPHTSNYDGVPALLASLAIDVDIRVLGKKQLFAVPILLHLLRWVGVMPIDRDKKGSVLQANIDRFATGKPFFLALAPEGTRACKPSFKTGFYYLALGAGVPIVPVALDYQSKQIRFMPPFEPTGDYDADLPKILAYYQGVTARHPKNMAKILQDLP